MTTMFDRQANASVYFNRSVEPAAECTREAGRSMANSDSIGQALEQEIREARALQTKPPNEACTCDWVILPLLWAAGYAKHEILSQGSTLGGGYPDYTILPGTQWTWYLEAKEWKRNLDNGADVVQALNYANARGHQWVVLSNGRQWLLFDNHLTGLEAPQRLVARAELSDPGFLDFMLALSRPSVTSGNLSQYVTKSRVQTLLDEQLADRGSETIRSIVSILKKNGVSGAQASDVAAYFAKAESHAERAAAPQQSLVKDAYTLTQLFAIRDRLPGTVPSQVKFPDGSSVAVPYWVDVAHQIVRWLAEQGKLPQMPFRGLDGGERWFLNRTPQHESGTKMTAPRQVATEQGPIYMDPNRSCSNFMRCLDSLCRSAGVPADGFAVQLRKPPSQAG